MPIILKSRRLFMQFETPYLGLFKEKNGNN